MELLLRALIAVLIAAVVYFVASLILPSFIAIIAAILVLLVAFLSVRYD
jgi:hypothetical protein